MSTQYAKAAAMAKDDYDFGRPVEEAMAKDDFPPYTLEELAEFERQEAEMDAEDAKKRAETEAYVYATMHTVYSCPDLSQHSLRAEYIEGKHKNTMPYTDSTTFYTELARKNAEQYQRKIRELLKEISRKEKNGTASPAEHEKLEKLRMSPQPSPTSVVRFWDRLG